MAICPGPCGCSGASPGCSPCSVGGVTLNLSWSDLYGDSGSTPLVYQGVISGSPTWQTGCVATPLWGAALGQYSFIFTLSCVPSTGIYTYTLVAYQTGSCTVHALTTPLSQTASCTPALNWVYKYTAASAVVWTGTVTL